MSIDYSILPLSKGEPRKRAKGRKLRAEAKQAKSVRATCEQRDGYCRLMTWAMCRGMDRCEGFGLAPVACDGPGEWAHMHSRRRSKTRNQAPDVRHDTKHSLMLCRFHHAEYDSKRLVITALTRKGADGALKFSRAKCSK